MKYKIFGRVLVLSLVFGLVGCSYFRPYHVPVQQGNVLEAKTERQLEIGMTKAEVEDLLGAPVLRNAFTDDYWTYVYTNQNNGSKIEKKQLVLYFTDNKLVKIK